MGSVMLDKPISELLPEDLIADWIDPKSNPKMLAKKAVTDIFFEKMVKDDPQIKQHFTIDGKAEYY